MQETDATKNVGTDDTASAEPAAETTETVQEPEPASPSADAEPQVAPASDGTPKSGDASQSEAPQSDASQSEKASEQPDDPFFKMGSLAADFINQMSELATGVFKSVNTVAGDALKVGVDGLSAGIQAAGHMVGDTVEGLVEASRTRTRDNEDFANRKHGVQLVLDSASLRLSSSELVEKLGNKQKPAEDALGSIAGPGCYIVLTFNHDPRDLSSIDRPIGGYVGTSPDMRHDAFAHVSGAGNADIYADVKYGKSVYFYFYPTASAAMDARALHFASELGPLVTYTAPTANDAAHGYADAEFEVVEEEVTTTESDTTEGATEGAADGAVESSAK